MSWIFLKKPGNLLEICLIKFVDTLYDSLLSVCLSQLGDRAFSGLLTTMFWQLSLPSMEGWVVLGDWFWVFFGVQNNWWHFWLCFGIRANKVAGICHINGCFSYKENVALFAKLPHPPPTRWRKERPQTEIKGLTWDMIEYLMPWDIDKNWLNFSNFTNSLKPPKCNTIIYKYYAVNGNKCRLR